MRSHGRVRQAEGDREAARLLFAEALSLAQRAGSRRIAAGALLDMSEVAQALGDLDAARAQIEEVFAIARDCGADHVVAKAFDRQGRLARTQGDLYQAEQSQHEAMRLWDQTGQSVCLAASLEALGGLATEQGRCEHGARLLGAAESFRETIGYVRPPAEQAAFEADIAAAQQGLAPDVLATAWEQGQAMSLEEAVAFAAKSRGSRRRPATGWASLTNAERGVALLAAQGLTNTEIGRRLFVSPRTVKAHLARIFAKLSITSRKQLPGGGQRGA